ncbi:MAG: hypothetical protein FWF08_08945 [Oscillospiraceae bacterium]|nr:hypothetical protein [Oscillospiraceae bacterium]
MMNKTMSNKTMKGLGTALAIGGAAAVIGTAVSKRSHHSMVNKRKVRKAADKAVKTVESIIDGVQGIMG